MRRKKIRIEIEGGGDFGERALPVAAVRGGPGGGQPRLKSLPAFASVHAGRASKTDSGRAPVRLAATGIRSLRAARADTRVRPYESPFCAILAHVSRSEAVRLNTIALSRDSMSTQK